MSLTFSSGRYASGIECVSHHDTSSCVTVTLLSVTARTGTFSSLPRRFRICTLHLHRRSNMKSSSLIGRFCIFIRVEGLECDIEGVFFLIKVELLRSAPVFLWKFCFLFLAVEERPSIPGEIRLFCFLFFSSQSLANSRNNNMLDSAGPCHMTCQSESVGTLERLSASPCLVLHVLILPGKTKCKSLPRPPCTYLASPYP
jgi:hypothetical protein